MEGKSYKFLVFWVHFHWFWVTTTAVLSPEGVNFEGKTCTNDLICLKLLLSPILNVFIWFLLAVQALMGFKDSIEDPHNVLDNWDQTSVDPCSWTMITCSSQNLVIGL